MLQLYITLIVWIAVAVSHATLGAEVYTPSNSRPVFPGSFEISDTSDQGSYLPRCFNCCPAKLSSEETCIGDFVSTFKKAVESSEDLSKLFGFFCYISAKDFSTGLYPESIRALTDIGAPYPKFVSRQIIKAIEESFDTMTSDVVLQIFANTMAKYLYIQDVSIRKNAVRLGKQYADTMEEAARCNDSPYTTLREGFVNFLKPLGLFTSDKALLVAFQFADALRLAANPRRG